MIMRIVRINGKLETYNKSVIGDETERVDSIHYTNKEGQDIDVVFWVRYPSYDFIFGVPIGGKRHKKEIGFFEYRSYPNKSVNLYVDIKECLEIIAGFSAILEKSKKNSLHLWSEYEKSRSKK